MRPEARAALVDRFAPGQPNRGKGTKTMVFTDGRGLPLAAEITSASPHKSTLIESLLERRLLPKKPRRLLYDLAADPYQLDNVVADPAYVDRVLAEGAEKARAVAGFIEVCEESFVAVNDSLNFASSDPLHNSF